MRRSSFVVVVCLAALVVLSSTGNGLAISGLASGGPAVRSQYPDAQDLASDASEAAPAATLATLQRDIRRQAGSRATTPEARQAAQREEANIAGRTITAQSAAGSGVREYGSVPLLLGAIGLISVGGVLRSRRGSSTLPPV